MVWNSDRAPGKTVILGAGGFIGINLAAALAAQGYDLICFDRLLSPHWPRAAKAIVGDFTTLPGELLRELDDDALVFHLISSCRPSADTARAADEIARDAVTTVRYLEETKTRKLRWVFLSSGGTVYGQKDDETIAESSSTNPICSYGAVKLAIERYFALYGVLHGVDHVVVRPSNPFGPWQYPLTGQGIVATLLYKVLRADPVEIWGDGTNVRDYIYIADAVAGIVAAAIAGKNGEIYNLGTGRGVSINRLIGVVGEALDREVNVKYFSARHIDVKRNVLDASKLSFDTGWTPTTTIDAGIDATVAWLKQNVAL